MHPSIRKRLQRCEADETGLAGDHYPFQRITEDLAPSRASYQLPFNRGSMVGGYTTTLPSFLRSMSTVSRLV